MLTDDLVDAYLVRIGAARPQTPDLSALRLLHERHVLSVPFENLDYHLEGTEIVMDERVVEKIAREHRGGGCYEINPSLAYLLRALGFTVTLLAAQVYRPDGLGFPQGHLVLRVDFPDGAWLVDAGFRRNSRQPLRIGATGVQRDPHGGYLLVESSEGAGFDLLLDDVPLYRVDPRPSRLADFGPALWWFRTFPGSPFRQDLFCSLPTVNGRVTLKGDLLTRTVLGERRTEVLPDDAAVLDAYQRYFGFVPDRLPTPPVVAAGTTGVQLD